MDLEIIEGEVLHVHVGDRCNNRCVFCNEDAAERRRRVKGTRVEDVAQAIARFPDIPEVLFTSGEPTLHPDLPQMISLARGEGHETVSLITNGRRLSDDTYLRSLVSAGLTKISVSVHGHTAAIHDALAGPPGAFDEARAGLANIATLRREGAHLHFSVNSIITRLNRPHLSKIFWFFAGFDPDEVVFNAVSPRSRGDEHYETLMDPYDVILAALEPLNVPFLDPPLRVMEIPGCVLARAGFLHTGARESWLVFERAVDDIETTAAMQPFFTKLDRCRRCRLEPVCEGVYRRYLELYGDEAIQPVERAQLLPRPLAELLHPLALDEEVAQGWTLTDVSLRHARGALLLSFRHRDGRALRFDLRKTPRGLRLEPRAEQAGELDLRAFTRAHAGLLRRLREVLAANAPALARTPRGAPS